jgi:DNA-binding transcriptional LysR family regulator
MNIKWIEDFVCLIESENFSRAAKKRFITQSAFSRRIQALEEWCGTQLVDRTKTPVAPTKAALDLLTTFRQIVNLSKDARRHAKKTKWEEQKSLKILVSNRAASFPGFLEQINRISIQLECRIEMHERDIVDAVKELEMLEVDLLIYLNSDIKKLGVIRKVSWKPISCYQSSRYETMRSAEHEQSHNSLEDCENFEQQAIVSDDEDTRKQSKQQYTYFCSEILQQKSTTDQSSAPSKKDEVDQKACSRDDFYDSITISHPNANSVTPTRNATESKKDCPMIGRIKRKAQSKEKTALDLFWNSLDALT